MSPMVFLQDMILPHLLKPHIPEIIMGIKTILHYLLELPKFVVDLQCLIAVVIKEVHDVEDTNFKLFFSLI
jgi:hypothetical protein